ncbi:hypothetical protein BP5796_02910 [Coleophoma crateriformis]|uniref:Protein kinase domain-containing protein n=1 Tax=Coleophoma crateriformis TaxID=565419 RepID=A0A3D8SLR2_9HELO|nr:hypothetical protein BP5796_02910 [Coleophoma crateriformis]
MAETFWSSGRSIQTLNSVEYSPGIHNTGDNVDASVPSVDTLSLPTFEFHAEADGTVPHIKYDVADDRTAPSSTSRNLKNWRHGDIKPENILRFINRSDDYLGVLKLADLGRAQQHLFVTKMRDTKEKELCRTRWYEPPDLEEVLYEEAKQKISRLFDIWSMGCVIFEVVLWLLHGRGAIQSFQKASGWTPAEQDATPYWEKDNSGKYQVSKVATKWMEHILEHDPERNGAIGSLVKLVKDRLLKTKLPADSDVYEEDHRTNAKDLKEQLALIIKEAEKNENYLFSGANRDNVMRPTTIAPKTNTLAYPSSRLSLSPDDAKIMNKSTAAGNRTTIANQREYTNRMNKGWKTPPNSSFAESHLTDRFGSSSLCSKCEEIDILLAHVSFDLGRLDTEDCELCELVNKVAKDLNLTSHSQIKFTRAGNDLILHGDKTGLKVLRLCCIKPEKEQVTRIPLGAPGLRNPNNYDPTIEQLDSFMQLPKAWLQECNVKHIDVCAPRHAKPELPKRLISIENLKRPKIIATADPALEPEKTDYVAFSHRWSNSPEEAVSTKLNIEQRMKRLIIDKLPLSFKNAIAATRALGCNYLWIDSLCILQGPDGEFDEEADKMQMTFNGAYCVLAACSAQSAEDGFLQNRKSDYVRKGDVYVSRVTNDFVRDVLHSPLARRGWVLQERALARRTIFFTKTQMYWECGDGVQCETLAKLKNDRIAFLGDANFPDYTIRKGGTAGEQIALFIDLFEQYTALEFSHPEDRPIAIDGLMDRLTTAFKTESLAGLFLRFWGRCLLWRRAAGTEPLKKIRHVAHARKSPPTWSWMAFEGKISFIQPKGGQVDWNDSEVTLPFHNRTQASWLKTSHQSSSVAIKATAYAFKIDTGAIKIEEVLFYDSSEVSINTSTKCVIVGREKQQR